MCIIRRLISFGQNCELGKSAITSPTPCHLLATGKEMAMRWRTPCRMARSFCTFLKETYKISKTKKFTRTPNSLPSPRQLCAASSLLHFLARNWQELTRGALPLRICDLWWWVTQRFSYWVVTKYSLSKNQFVNSIHSSVISRHKKSA